MVTGLEGPKGATWRQIGDVRVQEREMVVAAIGLQHGGE